jgi:hypothetical protein
MSERIPVEPEKQALNPDDEPDVQGHVLDSPVEKAALNPDDALDESDKAARKTR